MTIPPIQIAILDKLLVMSIINRTIDSFILLTTGRIQIIPLCSSGLLRTVLVRKNKRTGTVILNTAPYYCTVVQYTIALNNE
jgi:hypothetical protein